MLLQTGFHGENSTGGERIDPHKMHRLSGKIRERHHGLHQRSCPGYAFAALYGGPCRLREISPDFQISIPCDLCKSMMETFHGAAIGYRDGKKDSYPQRDASHA